MCYCRTNKFFFNFTDRPQSFRNEIGFSESGVVLGQDTPKWCFMKKQLMMGLKQHGDGLKHLEAMTIKYGEEMLIKMEDHGNKPFDPANLLVMVVANIMLTLIYGQTLEENAKKCIHCEEQWLKVFQTNGDYLMLEVLPITRFFVPRVKKAFEEFIMVVNDANRLYDNIIAAKRKNLQAS